MSPATIHFGPLKIDAAEFGSHGNAILGIKDSGKTYSATWFGEQLHAAGVPFVAFDPSGVWRFLRVPGKGTGTPVVVVGGVDSDLPLSPATAATVVEAAMQNHVSLVFDLSSQAEYLSKADWRRIVRDCMRILLAKNAPHGLRHVFIEEAAEFVPQRVFDGEVYAEVEKLARIGGNARLGYTLINQRAEEVNKAVLELCDNLFLHRQKGRNSLNALSKWLDIANVKDHHKVIESLSTLPTGECWAWLAEADSAARVKVPAKKSFHPDRRVMRGGIGIDAPKAIDVGGFVASMKATLPKIVEEAKANDPKALRAEIDRLKREAAKAGTPTKEALVAARAEGYQNGIRDGRDVADRQLRTVKAAVMGGMDYLTKHVTPLLADEHGEPPPLAVSARIEPRRNIIPAPPRATPKTNGTAEIGAERRILLVLINRHPARFTMRQWASIAGMKPTGGTWNTYVSRLRSGGWAEKDQDGMWRPTDQALQEFPPDQSAAVTPEQIRDQWKRALGGGPGRIIDALHESGGLDRSALAVAVEMTESGGTFNTYLSRLRSNGCIEVHSGAFMLAQELSDA